MRKKGAQTYSGRSESADYHARRWPVHTGQHSQAPRRRLKWRRTFADLNFTCSRKPVDLVNETAPQNHPSTAQRVPIS